MYKKIIETVFTRNKWKGDWGKVTKLSEKYGEKMFIYETIDWLTYYYGILKARSNDEVAN